MSFLVSLIIPVYNGQAYLESCVKSVMEQTYPNIECLLIDDGSTDNSLTIARALEERYQGRVKVYAKSNGGAASARNLGILKATGDYLMFADNDDQMAPDYVAQMVAELVRRDADMIFGAYRRVSEDGRVLYTRTPTSDPWSPYCFAAPWARILKTAYVRKNGLTFGEFPLGEDSYFTVQANDCSDKVYPFSYAGYDWVDHPTSFSNTVQKKSSQVSALTLLNALLARHPKALRTDPALYEYFFIKYAVWHLTYIARTSSKEEVEQAARTYFSWLDEHLPGWKKNTQLSLLKPAGEQALIRLTVWLLAKSPFRLKLFILWAYRVLSFV